MNIKISKIGFDDLAFWSFTLGVVLTVLGPVVHYSMFVVSIAALVYGKLKHGEPFFQLNISLFSRNIMFFLSIFTLWSMFAHVFNIASFHIWGKGATVYLEFILVIFLAARTINTEERRNKFLFLFVVFNTVFSLDVIGRGYWLTTNLNKSLNNINVAGVYGLLIMPFLCCYALWCCEKRIICKYLLITVNAALILFSFSSGAWLAAFFQALVLMFYGIKYKKITIKVILLGLLMLSLAFAAVDYIASGLPREALLREFGQISAAGDTEKLTNHRLDIWKATLYMSKQYPMSGWGRDTFEAEYENHVDQFVSELGFKSRHLYADPHGLYLSLIYSSGIPALLLFFVSVCLTLSSAFCVTSKKGLYSNAFPWSLMLLLMFTGQLVQGLTGDVLDARRDIGVIFGAAWGIFLAMPCSCDIKKRHSLTYLKVKREIFRKITTFNYFVSPFVPQIFVKLINQNWNALQVPIEDYAPRIKPPFDIESSDLKILDLSCTSGYGETVHPDVLYVPEGFGKESKKYLMTLTPLPNGTEYFENPEFLVSNEGLNWSLPKRGKSPVVDFPDDWVGYNSDPSLLLDGGILHMFYRAVEDRGRATRVTIKHISTSDGVAWSSADSLISSARKHNKDTAVLMSPTILKLADSYRMWLVSSSDSHLKVFLYESSDLLTWREREEVSFGGLEDGVEPWHLDVIDLNDGTLAMALCCFNAANPKVKSICFAKSSDNGRTWEATGDSFNPGTYGFGMQTLYRASLLHLDGDRYRLYYSGQNFDRHWFMAATEIRL